MVTGQLQRHRAIIGESEGSYSAEPGPLVTSEKAFADLWERSLELRPEIVGSDGKSYEILFPGVKNQGAGPDFKGAVLRHDVSTIGGDVELHLDSSGWRAHGHHGDPRYRGVVLQVVLKARGDKGGAPVPPTAEARFRKVVDGPSDRGPPIKASDLELLGIRRFRAKSAGFKFEFESVADPDQVVYASLLDAMGYARNRRPFRALADRVPFRTFAGLANEPSSSAVFAVVSALVVGGGLLADVQQFELLQMRRLARNMGVKQQVSPGAWSRFRVRPNNSPVSRIRGVAPLIATSLHTGLIGTLASVFDREGVAGLIREVERRPLIGRGLAVTVVANVMLPALHGYLMFKGSAFGSLERAFIEAPAPPQDAVTRGVCAVLGLDLRPTLASQHFGLHALARAKSWPGAGR